MSETRLIDPIADPAWLDFVASNPSGVVFHHPRWLDLLNRQYGYEIRACCIEGDRGIEAGIPVARIESRLTGKRLVSLPFSDICPPVLARDADPDALPLLSRALAKESRRDGLALTVHAALPSVPEALVQPRFFHHLLPLSNDPAEVERGYSKSQVKRGIRRAQRCGLRTERRTDPHALDAFYTLHAKTRRRLGVPTQPKRFVRRFEKLFAAGLGFVELVFDGQQPIAAAIFLTYNGTMTYKYGASEAGGLQKRPNNLLFSEVIRWGCESGFHALDFGRTDIDNEGLRSFKRSWGATEHRLSYTYVAQPEPSSEPGLRDRVMSAAIRRSPAMVSRLIGEALYGHFG